MKPSKRNKPPETNKMSSAETFHEIGLRVSDYISAMLSYWDKKSICRFANHAYLEWFERKKEDVVNKMSQQQLMGDLYKQHQNGIKKVLKGEKKIFENVQKLPSGLSRYFITTYYPDLVDGEVVGYFEQIIDTTSLKQMELKMLEMEQVKKREMLRSVIETQETEREAVAYELKDKINQTLAYCKMMLEKESNLEPAHIYLKSFSQYIHQAIDELNALSNKMSPSTITMLGFVAGVNEYLAAFKFKRKKIKISFQCQAEEIERMRGKDKIAIFRIIQDYLIMLTNNPQADIISLEVKYLHPSVLLSFNHNDIEFELPKKSKEYNDILHRVEYFGGQLKESIQKGQRKIEIYLLDI